ncbi:hypothetical protein [Cellulosilyticum sp. I15G10I2]|uniref:hypothetical protein n=1 Tax=Cellulosilyticum sp. I15G10I2 TaxID=1892843 RepID=UPI00085C2275|nr:hypothetical protein [Cellulosilyticum sp. I15G10I2]
MTDNNMKHSSVDTEASKNDTVTTELAGGQEERPEIQGSRIEQPVKKKLSPKLIGIIAAATVGICAVGVVVANAVVPVVLPQVFVAEALRNTQKVLLKEAKAIDDATGRALSTQIMQSEGVHTDFALKLESIEGEGAEYINGIIRGIGLSGQIKKDREAKNFLGNIAINQGALDLVRADFYKNNADIGIAIPKLFEKTIALNLDSFIQDYNQSALFALTGEPIDEAEYNTIRSYFETYGDQNFNEQLIENISKRSEEAFKSADIKYNGKTNAVLKDQGKSYRTYELTMQESEVKSYIKDIFNIVMEDEAVRNYIETADAMQSPVAGEKLSHALQKQIEEFNKTIDNMEGLALKTILRIDGNKQIIEATSETAVTIEGEKIEIALDAALMGDKFITDEVQIALAMRNQEQQAGLNFTSTSNYGEGAEKLVHNMIFEVHEDQLPLANMKLDMAYNTKAKENNLSVAAEIKTPDLALLSVVIEGAMQNNKNSKQISINMDKIALGFKGGYMDHTVNFSGKYALQAIKKSEIVFNQDNVQYLFDMTQEELINLTQTLYMGMMQIGSVLLP